ncbi:hypothetical protein HXX76_002383 [Chlamydomonas incerta]|uniref:ABM domain-containing protein n=1 Tax=Chlamydomonas incerta TaxID=51695 RepID=A0A835TB82_CHLIN|nr:hypothetical protein HXX76_002383 [Chlamydomonas incerta]|eukprot:KAG2442297.1 hypothetical protein HXX76_002383 [Chlamydomonas incerta]
MHPTEGKVFVLLVSGKVKEGQASAFTSCFQKLATYVAANEPGCLSYQLSFSDKDPDAFIIFERYTSAQYLEDVHWKSEPFAQFRKDLEAAGVEWVEKSVTRFYENGPGYMSK